VILKIQLSLCKKRYKVKILTITIYFSNDGNFAEEENNSFFPVN
jgi:hypothetical protein